MWVCIGLALVGVYVWWAGRNAPAEMPRPSISMHQAWSIGADMSDDGFDTDVPGWDEEWRLRVWKAEQYILLTLQMESSRTGRTLRELVLEHNARVRAEDDVELKSLLR